MTTMRWSLALLLLSTALSAQSTPYDFVIINARIVDGTGSPWFRGTVAVVNDSVAAVGHLVPQAGQVVVDAHDLVLAPGFIDTHSHGRREIFEVPAAENYIRQGVTSLIEGPDGSSPLPLRPYLDKLSAARIGINFGLLVGHGTVRSTVMGSENRKATPEEIGLMEELARQAMLDGAFGLSTGLFYVPGNYAPTEEVIAIAKVVGAMGGLHTSHMRDEAAGVIASVAETIRIGEEGGLPTQVTHHKIIGKQNWGQSQETIRLVEAARARGVDVTIDQYPYTASSTGTAAMFPQWALAGGAKALAERLSAPETRVKIKAEIVRRLIEDRGAGDPKNVVMASCGFDSTLAGKSLAEITAARERAVSFETAAETAIDIQLKGGCSAIYHAISEEDVIRILRYPNTMIASDGGIPVFGRDVPHPRSYGTFARVLGRYVREQKVLTLEEAVRRMSGLPAQRFKLMDRGLIRPGMKADLVLFDPARIADRSEFSNPHQYAVGVDSVWVNGKAALRDGKMTGELGGRPLYGPAYQKQRVTAGGMVIRPGKVGPVGANATEEELSRTLGPARVTRGAVHVGEGFEEPGTLIDGGDPSRALAITWKDEKQRKAPRTVFVCYGQRDGECRWRTDDGISAGTPLAQLEKLNGRPFRLLGFAWDYEGTIVDWSGGQLERWAGPARLLLRLSPAPDRMEWPEYRQVQGDREFSSAHPAMLKLNPAVYQMLMAYDTP